MQVDKVYHHPTLGVEINVIVKQILVMDMRLVRILILSSLFKNLLFVLILLSSPKLHSKYQLCDFSPED